MYKCQKCRKNSESGETQFKLITKIRKKIKGWEIEEEKKVCSDCYHKINTKS